MTNKQESNIQKSEKGRRAIATVLIIVMIIELGVMAFKYPGFLIHGDDKYNTELPNTPFLPGDSTDENGSQYNPEALKVTNQETINVSLDNLSAATSFGINVTLTEYAIKEDTEISITSKEKIYEGSGDYSISPVSIDMGNVHQLNDYVTIEIPYDESFMDSGESAEDCVCGVYFNPSTQKWEETLYTVDTQERKVIILTDHFSDFGAMTIKNKGRRNAYITDYKRIINNSIETETAAKSAKILKEYVDNGGSATPKAAQSGLATFIKNGGEAMGAALGAAADSTDAVNNYLSAVYAYDLSDVSQSFGYAQGLEFEQVAKGARLQKWQRVVNTYAKMGMSEPKNIFNDGKLSSLADSFATLGKILSVYKITMGVINGISEGDSQGIITLYKDCASLAVSLASDATIGFFMSGVYVADMMISTAYKEADGMRYEKISNSYDFYNRVYDGDSINGYRKSRTAADWREVIIGIIDENAASGNDLQGLIKQEISDYANHYWTITGAELGDVLACMPEGYTNIPQERSDERKKLTDAFIKQTYTELVPVMQSVQNYYSHKMEEEIKNSIEKIIEENNSYIPFAITDVFSGYESDYKGYTIKFFPLSQYADEKDWTFTMGADGCISDKFTFIGYEVAGRPFAIAVYEPGMDIESSDPVEIHPLYDSAGSGIHIVLDGISEDKKQENVKGVAVPIVEDSVYVRMGIELYGVDTVYSGNVIVKKNTDLSLDITVPAATNDNFKGYYDDEYYSFSFSEVTFHAVPDADASETWHEDGQYTCTADLTGKTMSVTSDHYQKGKKRTNITGVYKFADEATVTYAQENGKVYLYLMLPAQYEAKQTLYAISDSDVEQYINTSGEDSIRYECY